MKGKVICLLNIINYMHQNIVHMKTNRFIKVKAKDKKILIILGFHRMALIGNNIKTVKSVEFGSTSRKYIHFCIGY